jgi:hypothetical protein
MRHSAAVTRPADKNDMWAILDAARAVLEGDCVNETPTTPDFYRDEAE